MKFINLLLKRKSINYYVNQPLFSEEILATNCYEDLQKNGWSDIVNDSPDNLIKILKKL